MFAVHCTCRYLYTLSMRTTHTYIYICDTLHLLPQKGVRHEDNLSFLVLKTFLFSSIRPYFLGGLALGGCGPLRFP